LAIGTSALMALTKTLPGGTALAWSVLLDAMMTKSSPTGQLGCWLQHKLVRRLLLYGPRQTLLSELEQQEPPFVLLLLVEAEAEAGLLEGGGGEADLLPVEAEANLAVAGVEAGVVIGGEVLVAHYQYPLEYQPDSPLQGPCRPLWRRIGNSKPSPTSRLLSNSVVLSSRLFEHMECTRTPCSLSTIP
jgi:hypothetical protein